MRIAAIYALPGSVMRDNGKAQALLDDLIKERGNSGLEPRLDNHQLAVATLLRDFAVEGTKASTRARDDQKRLDGTQMKLDQAQKNVDALQARSDALQKKLDDLKSIEKTMIDRDVPRR